MTIKRLILVLLVFILMTTTLSFTNYTIINKDPYIDEPYTDWDSFTVGNGYLYGISGFLLYCIDTSTGRLNWFINTNYEIENSPILFDDKLIIGPDGTNFYCLDADTGNKIWALDVTRYFGKITSGYFGLTVSKKGNVYIMHKYSDKSKSKILCLNVKTGVKIWQQDMSKEIDFGFIVFSDGNYFSKFVDVVVSTKQFGRNAKFIAVRWAPIGYTWSANRLYADRTRNFEIGTSTDYTSDFNHISADIENSPIKQDFDLNKWLNVLYSELIDNENNDDSNLIEIDAKKCDILYIEDQTGKIRWEYKFKDYIFSQPMISNDMIYFETRNYYDSTRMLHCLYSGTGVEVWNRKVEGSFFPIIVNEGKVLIESGSDNLSIRRNLQCLDASTGIKIWEQNVSNPHDVTPTIILEDKYYIQSVDKKILCFDVKTGVEVWEQKISDYFNLQNKSNYADSKLLGSPIFKGKKIYVLCTPFVENYTLYYDKSIFLCLDAQSGEKIWDLVLPVNNSSDLIIVGGKIYAIQTNGDILCHNAYTSAILWEFKK